MRFGQLEYGYRFLQKYPPDYSSIGWLKTAGSAVAALLLFLAVRPAREQARPFFKGGMSEGHELSELREFMIAGLILTYLIWIVWNFGRHRERNQAGRPGLRLRLPFA